MNTTYNGIDEIPTAATDPADDNAATCACGPSCTCGAACQCQAGAACTPTCQCGV